MADNNDVFRMLAVEDKLDGTNYPLWSYMMRHVLVAKGMWNIIAGIDVRPASRAENAGIVVDEAELLRVILHSYRWLNHLHKIREGGMEEMHIPML